ncbi:MAG TPA: hypothetical protein VF727_15735 [Allosphingosinicella sp.]
MRKFPLYLIAVAALAAPASAAEKVGRRTSSPERMLEELRGLESAEEEAVAAAAAHPLGSTENPVRVGGPAGARAYLARLRCADGTRPKVGASAPAGVGAFGSVVEAFPLDCGAAAPGKFPLVVDIYHEEHVEDRAPAGFRIDSK